MYVDPDQLDNQNTTLFQTHNEATFILALHNCLAMKNISMHCLSIFPIKKDARLIWVKQRICPYKRALITFSVLGIFLNRKYCKQTVRILIRCLIWVCTACLCPIKELEPNMG